MMTFRELPIRYADREVSQIKLSHRNFKKRMAYDFKGPFGKTMSLNLSHKKNPHLNEAFRSQSTFKIPIKHLTFDENIVKIRHQKGLTKNNPTYCVAVLSPALMTSREKVAAMVDVVVRQVD